jgi:DNA-binding transcriptional MerR regulator
MRMTILSSQEEPMPTPDQTPTFNLKVVVRETGLRPDTLRAWERRYGLPHPQRTAGGHRLYSQRDIDLLKWLVSRQNEGLSVSRAVDLWRKLEAEGQDPLQAMAHAIPAPGLLAVPHLEGDALVELRRAWLSACLAFDEQRAEQVLTQALALYPPEVACFELLQKGLAEVGAGWYRGEVTVQQEHFTSELAIRRLEALLGATPSPTHPGRILVVCPPREGHTFSPLLLTLLLRRRGQPVFFFGPNVPLAHMETTVTAVKPRLVILSAQQLPTAARLLEMADLLRRRGVLLAFGGRVFNTLPALRAHIPGHFLGERLDLAPQAVEQLLASPHPPVPVQVAAEPYRLALAHFRERQALIEAQVRDAMQPSGMSYEHLSIAEAHLADDIAAALAFGDMDLMQADLAWVEALLRNRRLPAERLYHYLRVYQQAASAHLDERGTPILEWLARASEPDGLHEASQ